MLNRLSLWVTAGVTLVLALSACSSSVPAKTAASTPSKPSTTTSAGTVDPNTKAAPTPSRTLTPNRPRSVATLRSALISLDDLPSGYAVEQGSENDASGGGATSKDPKCAAFVSLSNASKAPGSTASAQRSFSGGQDGPFVDESIDALGSAQALRRLQASFKSAVTACRQVTLTLPGQGSSTMKVVEVSAPRFGDHPFAARLTARGGSLDGLEMTRVLTGLGDVVVSLTFVAANPDDVDGGTDAAISKAEDVLTTAVSGA